MTIISFFIEDWRNFAQKHNGKVVNTKTGTSPIGFGMSSWRKVYLKIPYHNSEIVFMTGEATRMEIFFEFNDKVTESFLIYPEDYMDTIAKFFKLTKEIHIGDEEFDRNYFIKSDHEELIRNVLQDDVKSFLLSNKKYVSNFKLEEFEGKSVLRYNAPFDENNISHMEDVLTLMKKTIDRIIENKN